MKRALLFASLLLVSACAVSNSSVRKKQWQVMQTSEVSALCKTASEKVISFSAYIEAELNESGFGGDAVALLGNNGNFYFEFTAPFGAQAVVASDGKLLYVWDVRNKIMAISPALKSVAVLVDLPLSATDFTNILHAKLPCVGKLRGFKFSDGSKQLVEVVNNRLFAIEFNLNGKPKRYAIIEGGKTKLLAEYFGSEPLLNYSAVKIKLDNGIAVLLRLRKESVKLLDNVSQTVFVPKPPPFVKRVYGKLRIKLPKTSH